MEKLEALKTPKPEFVSEVKIKTRSEMRVVFLSGKGDPMETFNEKVRKVHDWLAGRGVKPAGPILGIYHLNRDEVGLENVEWDACVPVEGRVETGQEIKFQTLPESKVASVVLTGGYDLIGPALKYMETVLGANGINHGWPLTEIYLKEDEELITELQYFVRNK